MVDIDDINENPETFDELTALEAKQRAKEASKPLIDHLPDAVVKDEMGLLALSAGPGDKLIIERYATVLSHRPWLDTKTYTITNVNLATGIVGLWDDDLHRSASTNFIEGVKCGYRFKLTTRKGMQIGKRKRGRPRKNPTDAPELAKPVELGPDGQPIKKRRGRPAGVKNRPKNVIVAEKKAKISKRKAKNR
jgi:hypothetical protein